MRWIVLLLAAVLVVVATGQVASASADRAGTALAIEDVHDLEPVTLPVRVAVAPLVSRPPIEVGVPASPERGRTHAVQVFRPPRLVASR